MIYLIKSSTCFSKKFSSSIQCIKKYRIGVVGVPFWHGQTKTGVEKGPDVLRSNGLLKSLNQIQKDKVFDFGNISLPQPMSILHNEELINEWPYINSIPVELLFSQMCFEIKTFIQNIVSKKFIPIVLGGDHSIAVGSILGTFNAAQEAGQDLSLIWIDAHADCNNERSSLSKNFHGMPLSHVIKNLSKIERFKNFKPCLNSKNVALIGLRNVDHEELKALKNSNIAYFSMKDIDHLGVHEVIARALDIVNPLNQNKIHVSFDVDSVDSELIPSTGTPERGGLTIREALSIAEFVHLNGNMVALDVVEFNPQIGTAKQVSMSANYIINIVMTFFGKSRLGYYNVENE